jgi:ribosome-associated translation inhibitor RaiA
LRQKMEEELEDFLSQEPLISSVKVFVKPTPDKKFKVDCEAHCWHKDFFYSKVGANLHRTLIEAERQLLKVVRENKKRHFKLRKRNYDDKYNDKYIDAFPILPGLETPSFL